MPFGPLDALRAVEHACGSDRGLQPCVLPLKPSLTAAPHNPGAGSGELMFTQRIRMALARAILDQSPVEPAEPVSSAETHRLMLAADRASARIAKWEKQPEPDPRPIAFWPADFVEGDQ